VLENELKFILNNERAVNVLRYIAAVCRPDPEFPHGVINTIYYDSARLSHLAEKANSDFLKTKFRVRWYGHPDDESYPPAEYFLEVKSRIGSKRTKRRCNIERSDYHIAEFALEDPFVCKVPHLFKQQGIILDDHLLPVIMIRYERYRFIEPLSGARISLDQDITVPKFNRRVLPQGREVTLRTAVVEVKGESTTLPTSLRWLTNFGLRKAAFSKYLSCVEKSAGVEVRL